MQHYNILQQQLTNIHTQKFITNLTWDEGSYFQQPLPPLRLLFVWASGAAGVWRAKEIGPNMHCVNLDVIRPRWGIRFEPWGKRLTSFLVGSWFGEEFYFFFVVVIGTWNSWGTFHWKTLGVTFYQGYISLSSPFLKETISLDALVFYWTIWMKKTPSIFFTTTPTNMTFLLQHQT